MSCYKLIEPHLYVVKEELARGYTGHEHLTLVSLIHMNGRLYDPQLHRFLSPDNFVQDPYNTQNYNRYGYVLNNPLKYTDPSGEFIIIPILALVVKAIIITAIKYTIDAAISPEGIKSMSFMGFAKAVVIGAATGFVTGGIGSAIVGGNFWQGAVVGCLVAGANHALHAVVNDLTLRGSVRSYAKTQSNKTPNFDKSQVASIIKGVPILTKIYGDTQNQDYSVNSNLTDGGGMPINGLVTTIDVNDSSGNLIGVTIESVEFGTKAFESFYRLASTIYHEFNHVIDYNSGFFVNAVNSCSNRESGKAYAKDLLEIRSYQLQVGLGDASRRDLLEIHVKKMQYSTNQ